MSDSEKKSWGNLLDKSKNVQISSNKPQPSSGGKLKDELDSLIRQVGHHYGTDEVSVHRFKKNVANNDYGDKKTKKAVQHLKDVLKDIKESADPNDKRVFCKNCVNFSGNGGCACAKAGAFGEKNTRFQPAPYVPRTCQEFFPGLENMMIPPPPGKIRVMSKDTSKSYEYGYHPHDEKWIKEKIEEKVGADNPEQFEPVMKAYKAKFQSYYADTECPENGADGYARRLANIWLRDELKNMDLKIERKAEEMAMSPT